jgi:uncharacterized membrane protein
MTTSTQKRHELKRIALHYQGDGLMDIYTGLIILSFGMLILVDMGWMSGVFVAVFLPTWLTVKQSLMSSRLSYSEIEQAGVHGSTGTRVRLIILGLLGLIVGLVAFLLLTSGFIAESSRLWLSENFSILAGLLSGIVLAIIGAVIKAPRFYGYAILSVAIIGIGALLGVGFPLTVVAVGVIILGVGTVLLIRFLRMHPKIEREQNW